MDIAAKNTFLARSLCVSDMTGGDLGLACAVQDDVVESGISIWTHFGGNLVSPKWMIEDGRDIWVVKCPFSSKTDRVATQRSCALDYPEVARTISVAVWWAGRITKTLLDRNSHSRDVIPAGTKWRAGTLWDFAAGGLGLGCAVRDDIVSLNDTQHL